MSEAPTPIDRKDDPLEDLKYSIEIMVYGGLGAPIYRTATDSTHRSILGIILETGDTDEYLVLATDGSSALFTPKDPNHQEPAREKFGPNGSGQELSDLEPKQFGSSLTDAISQASVYLKRTVDSRDNPQLIIDKTKDALSRARENRNKRRENQSLAFIEINKLLKDFTDKDD